MFAVAHDLTTVFIARALAGFFVGGTPFGIIAMIFAYRIVARLGRETVPPSVKSEAPARA